MKNKPSQNKASKAETSLCFLDQTFIGQIKLRFLLLLGIFIALFSFEYVALEFQAKTTANYEYLINRTGYQRMLTQRVALLSVKLVHSSHNRPELRENLHRYIQKLESWHRQLPSEGSKDTKKILEDIYFKPPNLFDEQMSIYVNSAKSLANSPDTSLTPNNEYFRRVNAISEEHPKILESLEKIVKVLELESKSSQAQQDYFIKGLLLLNIAISILSYQFLLKPMVDFIRLNQEKVEKEKSETQLLQEIITEINAAEDSVECLEIVLSKVSNLTGWVFGQAWLPSEDNDFLECHSSWYDQANERLQQFRDKNKNARFQPGQGIPGRVWSSKASHWILDVVKDSNFPRAALAQEAGFKTALGIPVLADGDVVAVIEFFMFNVRAKDERLVETITTVCQQLGNFILRKKMQAAIKEAHKALEIRVEERTKALSKVNAALEQELASRQQLEIQMVQTDKLATVGQLAAGVAHEINNPIGFIMSNLETLTGYIKVFKRLIHALDSLVEAERSQSSTDEKRLITEEVDEIRQSEDTAFILDDVDTLLRESIDGTVRVHEIVKNLKSFARIDEAEIKEADLNEELETTLKIVWNELKYKCKVVKNFGDIPLTYCNPGQLNQVFMNLLVNAAQAIEDKGEIRIETKTDGSRIHIEIADTGKGISQQHLQRIFDPFFTTKPVGKGTGLGLSISYGIIQKHNGTIDVTSEPGKGTTFSITLPIDEGNENHD